MLMPLTYFNCNKHIIENAKWLPNRVYRTIFLLLEVFHFQTQMGVSYSGPLKIAQTSRLRTSGYRSSNQGAGQAQRGEGAALATVTLGASCSEAPAPTRARPGWFHEGDPFGN